MQNYVGLFSFRLYSEYIHLVRSKGYGPEDFHNRIISQLSLLQTCLNTSSTESCAYQSKVCIACCENVVGYSLFYILAYVKLSSSYRVENMQE